MAPQRCIAFLSFVIVFILFYISSYHGDYTSGSSRAYTWYMKTIKDVMFQESDVFDSLALVSTKTFDVDSFGAKGDGKKDDTKCIVFMLHVHACVVLGIQECMKEACSSKTAAVFHVAKNKKYLVAPIRFKGPCKASLTMQISGTILASKQESKYTKDETHWLRVDEVENLVIEGGGVIDGNGDIWWSHSCKVDKKLPCKDAPTMHVSFDHCENVQVSNVQVTTPEDSPNTDGIHVTHTQNITISDSAIGTGDDCISIVSGSKGVQAAGITCGPGHGISIGSLGSKNSEAHVSDVTIDGADITGTSNGLRIKTWQIKRAKNSKKHPCQGVVLKNINLTQMDDGDAKAICNNVELTYIKTVIPRCPKNTDQDRLAFEA
ncbi:hypothetical protein L1987_29446 [Smallanthus sonchifolius]|uniref:Uncharacterized protein n=1 Tax=Smallanthus sonchifolius TaxID=185202 RepID=A0ACB9I2P1_9ASTR|nr:hypothetical protein L1987_29446 [Smallanthus sonchifolius]